MTTPIQPSDRNLEPFKEILHKISAGLPPDPVKAQSHFDFTQDTSKEGLLAKVLEKAGDAVMSYAEVRQLLGSAIRDKMNDSLETMKGPFSALVAAISDNALLMNMSTMGTGIGTSMFLALAPLFVDGAISTISKVLRPETSPSITKREKAVESFLGSLIGLPIQAGLFADMKIVIPIQNRATPAFMMQEMEKAKEEFATLFAVAQRDGLDTSAIAAFKDAPSQALAFLQGMRSGEEGYTLSLLGVWAANRNIVQAVLFKQPYEELRLRYNKVKNTLRYDVHHTEEQAQQLALAEELLNTMPLLANYETIKQLLDELEESIESNKTKAIALERSILFQAANEIRQIASGKTTVEYHYVGVMHTQLEKLAKRLDQLLPKNAEELSKGQMDAIARAIVDCLHLIRTENPHALSIILKSHPRTLLYLLHTHSFLVEDVSMPALSTPTEKQCNKFDEAVQRLSKWKAFFRYQPGALRALLHEVKGGIVSEFAKISLRIVYKAILEMLSSLDDVEASPYFELLNAEEL